MRYMCLGCALCCRLHPSAPPTHPTPPPRSPLLRFQQGIADRLKAVEVDPNDKSVGAFFKRFR